MLRRIIGQHADALPEGSEVQKIRKTALQLSFDADMAIDIHCDRDAIVHAYTYGSIWPDVSDLCAQTGCEAVLLEDGTEDAGTSTDLFTGTWELVRKELGHLFPVPIGSAVAIRTRTDGIVASLTLIRFVPRGEIVAKIVGTVPLRSGALLEP